MDSPRAYETAFIIEQALGHVTHGDNLRTHVPNQPGIRPHWISPPYEVAGAAGRVPVYRSNWTVRSGLYTRRSLRRLRSEVPLDLLFFHTQTPAMLCGDWVRRIPSVVSVDATPLQYDELGPYYRHEVGSRPVENLKTRLAISRFAAASHLIAWSDWAKQGLVEHYQVPPERISVIPPGVTIGDWAPPKVRPNRAAEVKILFVGGDFERKGGRLLVEAFRGIRHLGVELHLVTQDPVPAEEGVFVHQGIRPNSHALHELFRSSDLFVLPTLGDCLPMVLSEAGAAGLPAISTCVAAIPEVIVDGQTGILVPNGDLNALTRALRRLVERPDERTRMGELASAHIARRYDTAKNTQMLVEVLKAAGDERYGTKGPRT